MEKIKRNDPCPCGSGKKFKDCCIEKEKEFEIYRERIEQAYGQCLDLDRRNFKLKESNQTPEKMIDDAFFFGFTCNALSFLKALLENNYLNSSSLLSLRNMLEYYAMMEKIDQDGIGCIDKKIFFNQTEILKYKVKEIYKGVIPEEELKHINNIYQETLGYLIKEKELKLKKAEKILRYQIPYFCDKDVKYVKIIEEMSPELAYLYGVISIYVHPYDCVELLNHFNFNIFLKKLLDKILGDLEKLGRKYYIYDEIKKSLLLESSNNKIDNITFKQYEIIQKIINVYQQIFGIKKDIIVRTLQNASNMMKDINLDMLLGLCESVKIKVKSLFETIALFYEILVIDINDIEFTNKKIEYFDLYQAYIVSEKFQEKDKKEKILNEAYQKYKKEEAFKDISLIDFENIFRNTLGCFIDPKTKKSLTMTQLTKNYINLFTKEDKDKNKFMLQLYMESQLMSHATGYLYFTSGREWCGDIEVIKLYDKMMLDLLEKIQETINRRGITQEQKEKLNFKKEISKFKKLVGEKELELLKINR